MKSATRQTFHLWHDLFSFASLEYIAFGLRSCGVWAPFCRGRTSEFDKNNNPTIHPSSENHYLHTSMYKLQFIRFHSFQVYCVQGLRSRVSSPFIYALIRHYAPTEEVAILLIEPSYGSDENCLFGSVKEEQGWGGGHDIFSQFQPRQTMPATCSELQAHAD